MDNNIEMHVIKRSGTVVPVLFDKILNRIKNLGIYDKRFKYKLNVNYSNIVIKVVDQLFNGISTAQIDELLAQQCSSLAAEHFDHFILAGRILISNHQKKTEENYLKVVEKLHKFTDVHGKKSQLISDELYKVVSENAQKIQSYIDYDRDFLIDYFGWKTLERAYLMKINGEIVERPQHMWMRVAIGIHGNDMDKVKTTYDLMSKKYFTHATPTLFNAGTPRPQCSSCYLLAMEKDSIGGIYRTLSDCAEISKWAGGIGLHIHNIRGRGSHIRGTNGTSNGIVPMLKVYNGTARYVDQGGGRRNGSFAVYLEPWHSDIESFLEMKKNHGDEEQRARDLFYALWIPDLFMKRVHADADWTLLCPDQCPGLSDCYGEEFEKLYLKYEKEKLVKKTISARKLWFKILDSQMETGTPYMLYKDACNQKSNQKNLGTIKSSNLCTEIIEYSNEEQTAVCNLASVGLAMFVDEEKNYNYEELHNVVKVITENLNKVIDINFYPTPKTKLSNFLHRPIGIGVQGLADTFAKMNIPFHSEEAKEINIKIFETIYHAALEKSCEIAQSRYENMEKLRKIKKHWKFLEKNKDCREYILDGSPSFRESIRELLDDVHPIKAEMDNLDHKLSGAYSSFKGSPASKGILQFDLWDIHPSKRYNWRILKNKIKEYGLRNSLLVAPMPTASTSQILGNNECFEPFTSLIYVRRTLAGEFVCVNKYMQKELIDMGIWSTEMKNSIIKHQGSIQHIKEIPQHIRDKYKIVWEMPMKHILEMSRDRGAYIDQSQSLNLWVANPNYKVLTAIHFFGWKQGLKTGMYYLRTRAKAAPQQFTIEPTKKVQEPECLSCGS